MATKNLKRISIMKIKIFGISLLSLLLVLVSCKNGEKNEPQPYQEIQDIILQESITLNVGESKAVSVSVKPEGAKVSDLVWESSNVGVCTVDDNGVVTGVGTGKSSIVAKFGSLEKMCIVRVNEVVREYELVWEDNFDGTSLNTSFWNVQSGYPQNNEQQYYTDQNHYVKDGLLVLQAKKESFMGKNYTSARLHTKDKVKFTYGKFEARISFPAGKGTWPAFWLMPNDSYYGGWPLSGEIDIVEHWGSNANIVSHAVHTANANGGSSSKGQQWTCQYTTVTPAVENNFHVYSCEWIQSYNNGKDAIFFYVDGVLQNPKAYTVQLSNDYRDWPFNKDFYVILNLALGGNLGGPIDDAIFANDVLMKVDYVKIYQVKK